MAEKNRMPWWGRILLGIFSLVMVLALGFVIWGETPPKPMPEAMAALQAAVPEGEWLTFQPAGGQPTTGLILYPGGRVDYRAYAPAARAIADQGYLVIIIRMPLNLAVFKVGAAADAISAYPAIKNWAIGGHSLGGSMAANFVFTHPQTVKGLVLWASYPAANNDLSRLDIRVLSISGKQDGLATPDKIAASVHLLPADTTWLAIQGGDHAGFGWYGPQAGDRPATITRIEQQAQIVNATVEFLKLIK
jgi:pimeloyl-ACP methyl ester carboxylesterase